MNVLGYQAPAGRMPIIHPPSVDFDRFLSACDRSAMRVDHRFRVEISAGPASFQLFRCTLGRRSARLAPGLRACPRVTVAAVFRRTPLPWQTATKGDADQADPVGMARSGPEHKNARVNGLCGRQMGPCTRPAQVPLPPPQARADGVLVEKSRTGQHTAACPAAKGRQRAALPDGASPPMNL